MFTFTTNAFVAGETSPVEEQLHLRGNARHHTLVEDLKNALNWGVLAANGFVDADEDPARMLGLQASLHTTGTFVARGADTGVYTVAEAAEMFNDRVLGLVLV